MLQGFRNVCKVGLRAHAQSRYSTSTSSGSSSSVKSEWRKRRNIMFNNELERQKSEIGRIEKISVMYHPVDKYADPIEMRMNKNTSTPTDCAKHISLDIFKNAALAVVDDNPWDMHKPFVKDCDLKLLTMQMPKDLPAINTAFWRTCSLLLGAMIELSFKDDIPMYLHSFPWPNIKSGSFVYDVILDLEDWKPTNAELRALSAQFVKLCRQELPVERLEVSEELALDMFQDNPFKSKQIPNIAKSNVNNRLTLYRVGDHIDISKGPMVGHTGIVGRSTIASVHKIESDESDRMYRFQGVALPCGNYLNHVAFGILENRARKLNKTHFVPHKADNADNADLEENSGIIARILG